MNEYDIRIHPIYINTKLNIKADALSRLDWNRFAESVGLSRAYAKALGNGKTWAIELVKSLFSAEAKVITDYDDWMVIKTIFDELWAAYGPFEWDAAADEFGSNSYLDISRTWSLVNSALVNKWDGLNVYCNPPYSIIMDFLLHFLQCKKRAPLGTSAVFIVPMWEGTGFWQLISAYPTVFVPVRTFPRKSRLFTSPNQMGVNRKDCGPTKWPVVVIRVGPEPLNVDIDLNKWVGL
jgi:hypothetical protein